jgi:hypothetical protein
MRCYWLHLYSASSSNPNHKVPTCLSNPPPPSLTLYDPLEGTPSIGPVHILNIRLQIDTFRRASYTPSVPLNHANLITKHAHVAQLCQKEAQN